MLHLCVYCMPLTAKFQSGWCVLMMYVHMCVYVWYMQLISKVQRKWYVYVCVHVCSCVCACVYMFMCIPVCVCMCLYLCVYVLSWDKAIEKERKKKNQVFRLWVTTTKWFWGAVLRQFEKIGPLIYHVWQLWLKDLADPRIMSLRAPWPVCTSHLTSL